MMKAVVFHGIGDIRLQTVPEPTVLEPTNAIDRVPSRLETARAQGAETINFDREDPVETGLRITGGTGTHRRAMAARRCDRGLRGLRFA